MKGRLRLLAVLLLLALILPIAAATAVPSTLSRVSGDSAVEHLARGHSLELLGLSDDTVWTYLPVGGGEASILSSTHEPVHLSDATPISVLEPRIRELVVDMAKHTSDSAVVHLTLSLLEGRSDPTFSIWSESESFPRLHLHAAHLKSVRIVGGNAASESFIVDELPASFSGSLVIDTGSGLDDSIIVTAPLTGLDGLTLKSEGPVTARQALMGACPVEIISSSPIVVGTCSCSTTLGITLRGSAVSASNLLTDDGNVLVEGINTMSNQGTGVSLGGLFISGSGDATITGDHNSGIGVDLGPVSMSGGEGIVMGRSLSPTGGFVGTEVSDSMTLMNGPEFVIFGESLTADGVFFQFGASFLVTAYDVTVTGRTFADGARGIFLRGGHTFTDSSVEFDGFANASGSTRGMLLNSGTITANESDVTFDGDTLGDDAPIGVQWESTFTVNMDSASSNLLEVIGSVDGTSNTGFGLDLDGIVSCVGTCDFAAFGHVEAVTFTSNNNAAVRVRDNLTGFSVVSYSSTPGSGVGQYGGCTFAGNALSALEMNVDCTGRSTHAINFLSSSTVTVTNTLTLDGVMVQDGNGDTAVQIQNANVVAGRLEGTTTYNSSGGSNHRGFTLSSTGSLSVDSALYDITVNGAGSGCFGFLMFGSHTFRNTGSSADTVIFNIDVAATGGSVGARFEDFATLTNQFGGGFEFEGSIACPGATCQGIHVMDNLSAFAPLSFVGITGGGGAGILIEGGLSLDNSGVNIGYPLDMNGSCSSGQACIGVHVPGSIETRAQSIVIDGQGSGTAACVQIPNSGEITATGNGLVSTLVITGDEQAGDCSHGIFVAGTLGPTSGTTPPFMEMTLIGRGRTGIQFAPLAAISASGQLLIRGTGTRTTGIVVESLSVVGTARSPSDVVALEGLGEGSCSVGVNLVTFPTLTYDNHNIDAQMDVSDGATGVLFGTGTYSPSFLSPTGLRIISITGDVTSSGFGSLVGVNMMACSFVAGGAEVEIIGTIDGIILNTNSHTGVFLPQTLDISEVPMFVVESEIGPGIGSATGVIFNAPSLQAVGSLLSGSFRIVTTFDSTSSSPDSIGIDLTFLALSGFSSIELLVDHDVSAGGSFDGISLFECTLAASEISIIADAGGAGVGIDIQRNVVLSEIVTSGSLVVSGTANALVGGISDNSGGARGVFAQEVALRGTSVLISGKVIDNFPGVSTTNNDNVGLELDSSVITIFGSSLAEPPIVGETAGPGIDSIAVSLVDCFVLATSPLADIGGTGQFILGSVASGVTDGIGVFIENTNFQLGPNDRIVIDGRTQDATTLTSRAVVISGVNNFTSDLEITAMSESGTALDIGGTFVLADSVGLQLFGVVGSGVGDGIHSTAFYDIALPGSSSVIIDGEAGSSGGDGVVFVLNVQSSNLAFWTITGSGSTGSGSSDGIDLTGIENLALSGVEMLAVGTPGGGSGDSDCTGVRLSGFFHLDGEDFRIIGEAGSADGANNYCVLLDTVSIGSTNSGSVFDVVLEGRGTMSGDGYSVGILTSSISLDGEINAGLSIFSGVVTVGGGILMDSSMLSLPGDVTSIIGRSGTVIAGTHAVSISNCNIALANDMTITGIAEVDNMVHNDGIFMDGTTVTALASLTNLALEGSSFDVGVEVSNLVADMNVAFDITGSSSTSIGVSLSGDLVSNGLGGLVVSGSGLTAGIVQSGSTFITLDTTGVPLLITGDAPLTGVVLFGNIDASGPVTVNGGQNTVGDFGISFLAIEAQDGSITLNGDGFLIGVSTNGPSAILTAPVINVNGNVLDSQDPSVAAVCLADVDVTGQLTIDGENDSTQIAAHGILIGDMRIGDGHSVIATGVSGTGSESSGIVFTDCSLSGASTVIVSAGASLSVTGTATGTASASGVLLPASCLLQCTDVNCIAEITGVGAESGVDFRGTTQSFGSVTVTGTGGLAANADSPGIEFGNGSLDVVSTLVVDGTGTCSDTTCPGISVIGTLSVDGDAVTSFSGNGGGMSSDISVAASLLITKEAGSFTFEQSLAVEDAALVELSGSNYDAFFNGFTLGSGSVLSPQFVGTAFLTEATYAIEGGFFSTDSMFDTDIEYTPNVLNLNDGFFIADHDFTVTGASSTFSITSTGGTSTAAIDSLFAIGKNVVIGDATRPLDFTGSSLTANSFTSGSMSTVSLIGGSYSVVADMTVNGALEASNTVVIDSTTGDVELNNVEMTLVTDTLLISGQEIDIQGPNMMVAGTISATSVVETNVAGTWTESQGTLSLAGSGTTFMAANTALANLVVSDTVGVEIRPSSQRGCISAVNVSFTGQSKLFMDLTQPGGCSSNDFIQMTGTLTLGPMAPYPTLTVRHAGPDPDPTDIFELIEASMVVGQFDNLPAGSSVAVGDASLTLLYDFGSGSTVALAGLLEPGMDDMYTTIGVLVVAAPGVLENDRIQPEPMLMAELVNDVQMGGLTFNADGSFTYNPQGFLGTVVFQYRLREGLLASDLIDVTITAILPSNTRTPSLSETPTLSISRTVSASTSKTISRTRTATRTMSSTPTLSESVTISVTPSKSFSRTVTNSASVSESGTPSMSGTPTTTVTSSSSPTPSKTSTPSPSSTQTPSQTPSHTVTTSETPTTTVSSGGTPANTVSASETPTTTLTASNTVSMSKTMSSTPSATPSSSATPTMTPTASSTLSLSSTPSSTESSSGTPSISETSSKSLSRTRTSSKTRSRTPSTSTTPSASKTLTPSPSSSQTQTPTQTQTSTSSGSRSAVATPSSSPSQTRSATSTQTGTMTPTQTFSSSKTQTRSPTPTKTVTGTPSITATPTVPMIASFSSTATVTPSNDAAAAAPGGAVPSSGTLGSPSRTRTISRVQTPTKTRTPSLVFDFSLGGLLGQDGSAVGTVDQTVEMTVSTLTSNSRTGPVDVTNFAGLRLATVDLPALDVNAALVVSGEGNDVVLIPEVSSVVIDVNVIDTDGGLITNFDDAIEICFSTDLSEDEVCLGFFNDDGEWECEDFCLDSSDGQLCGESDHLTNFALLLSDDAGSDSRCGSSESIDYLYMILSCVAVVVALVIIIAAIVVYEAKVRMETMDTTRRLSFTPKAAAAAAPAGLGDYGSLNSSTDFVEPLLEE